MEHQLLVPEGLHFSELKLEREPGTKRLLYAATPLADLCRYNGFDPTTTFADEDLACWLICEWYVAHRSHGGALDVVAELILVEAQAAQTRNLSVSKDAGDLENSAGSA